MEYNAEKRWDTNATFLSATMTFPRRRRRLQRRSRRNSMSVNTITAPGSVMVIAASALFILITTAALAEVDIRTPWANVYVGPGGVYVHGPWGRVEVPAADRERVCRQWRDNVLEHYKDRDCRIEFDAIGCVIEKVDCAK